MYLQRVWHLKILIVRMFTLNLSFFCRLIFVKFFYKNLNQNWTLEKAFCRKIRRLLLTLNVSFLIKNPFGCLFCLEISKTLISISKQKFHFFFYQNFSAFFLRTLWKGTLKSSRIIRYCFHITIMFFCYFQVHCSFSASIVYFD